VHPELKLSVQIPMGAIKHWERWIGTRHLSDVAIAAEQAGFDAISVTDHPFPPDAWLAAGGHHSFDPFVALSWMGAATSRIRLLTNLIVAAYRSPYVTAKAASSLDYLSGGRAILGMGAGYLEPEFAVLGAQFGGRGARFDAAIEAIRAAWTGESVTIPDGPFAVAEHTTLPRPAQPSGPPIWIGGNSKAARQRVAKHGDGWMPFQQGEEMARITGTAVVSGLDDIAAGHADIKAGWAAAGRAGAPDVCFCPQHRGTVEQWCETVLGRERDYAAAGVTWLAYESHVRSVEEFLAEMAAFQAALS
jgi:probable F420-dependent oxidoreductase